DQPLAEHISRGARRFEIRMADQNNKLVHALRAFHCLGAGHPLRIFRFRHHRDQVGIERKPVLKPPADDADREDQQEDIDAKARPVHGLAPGRTRAAASISSTGAICCSEKVITSRSPLLLTISTVSRNSPIEKLRYANGRLSPLAFGVKRSEYLPSAGRSFRPVSSSIGCQLPPRLLSSGSRSSLKPGNCLKLRRVTSTPSTDWMRPSSSITMRPKKGSSVCQTSEARGSRKKDPSERIGRSKPRKWRSCTKRPISPSPSFRL